MKYLGVINFPTIAGDEASPANGDIWYNSTIGKFRKRENGLTSDLDTTASGSGITRVISSVSATTTGASASSTDYVYLCTGTFTYTQPTAVGNTNLYKIKNAGTGIITIVFTSGQNADSITSLNLNPNQAIELVSNNTNYNII